MSVEIEIPAYAEAIKLQQGGYDDFFKKFAPGVAKKIITAYIEGRNYLSIGVVFENSKFTSRLAKDLTEIFEDRGWSLDITSQDGQSLKVTL